MHSRGSYRSDRVKFKDFSRIFKVMYQEIQGLKSSNGNFNELKDMNKINLQKCPILNAKQFSSENINYKQEQFKDFQALLYKLKNFQGLEFLFSNSRTFKFCTNPVH